MPTNKNNFDNFWGWFDRAHNDAPIRKIEEDASVPRGRIGNAYSEKRKPTFKVCEAIADGLGLPNQEVLIKAGIWHKHYAENAEEENLLAYFRMLKPEHRIFTLDIIKALSRNSSEVN